MITDRLWHFTSHAVLLLVHGEHAQDARQEVAGEHLVVQLTNAHHAAVEQDWRSDIKNPKGSL